MINSLTLTLSLTKIFYFIMSWSTFQKSVVFIRSYQSGIRLMFHGVEVALIIGIGILSAAQWSYRVCSIFA